MPSPNTSTNTSTETSDTGSKPKSPELSLDKYLEYLAPTHRAKVELTEERRVSSFRADRIKFLESDLRHLDNINKRLDEHNEKITDNLKSLEEKITQQEQELEKLSAQNIHTTRDRDDYFAELRTAQDKIIKLKIRIADLQKGGATFCVFCGAQFEEDPIERLKKHIEVCPKHPMCELKNTIKELKEKIDVSDGIIPQLTEENFGLAYNVSFHEGTIKLLTEENTILVRELINLRDLITGKCTHGILFRNCCDCKKIFNSEVDKFLAGDVIKNNSQQQQVPRDIELTKLKDIIIQARETERQALSDFAKLNNFLVQEHTYSPSRCACAICGGSKKINTTDCPIICEDCARKCKCNIKPKKDQE